MYAKSVCATNFGSLGEIGANFSLQLSSRTQFAKINNKKVIAENQCEKHKKSSFFFFILFFFFFLERSAQDREVLMIDTLSPLL